ALHEVERVVRRRVPDVGRVVRGDAAHVDAGDGAGVEGDGSTGRGVVDPQVAALTGQGGDFGSGPGMHGSSLTGPEFRIRTGAGRMAVKALLRAGARCARAPPPRRAARGSRATVRPARGACRRRAWPRRAPGWRRSPLR